MMHRSALKSAERNRSEEHTSELQSPCNLVCRLLLEKKKKKTTSVTLYQVNYKHVVSYKQCSIISSAVISMSCHALFHCLAVVCRYSDSCVCYSYTVTAT